MIAGPCSVESREQILEVAHLVKQAGASGLRGGAFKPRSSLYSFQGLKEKGLQLLAEAREQTGLAVVTEVMAPEHVPLVANHADVLQVGATGFGFLSAALSVGALLSTLWLAWSNERPTIRRVLAGMLVFGVLEVVFAVSRLYLLSIALIASIGFVETAFATLALTTLQAVVPDHLRGRVTSVQVLFFDGSVPPGYLLTGWLASLWGAPVAVFIGALLSLLVAGAGWIWRKPAEANIANQGEGSLATTD